MFWLFGFPVDVSDMIKTIVWENDSVVIIDQRMLPLKEHYLVCHRYNEVVHAIKNLAIRGAPAIGIAAAMGIALGTRHTKATSVEDLKSDFYHICDEFAAARPTAINLFWAIDRMKRCLLENWGEDIESIKNILKKEAIRILDDDVRINRLIGCNGQELINQEDSILTHCNAGALATGGYGTALGVIRAAHEAEKNIHVFVDETRPVLQGARLTTWELQQEHIAATLITDNMAGYFMQKGKINCVIVGADRIAMNGDTANKIGTYTVAVLAREHGVPFYVAAPSSTIDVKAEDGDSIPIEKRNGAEVTTIGKTLIAPKGVNVCNPAFDVTPARYITAIITETGILYPPFCERIMKMVLQ